MTAGQFSSPCGDLRADGRLDTSGRRGNPHEGGQVRGCDPVAEECYLSAGRPALSAIWLKPLPRLDVPRSVGDERCGWNVLSCGAFACVCATSTLRGAAPTTKPQGGAVTFTDITRRPASIPPRERREPGQAHRRDDGIRRAVLRLRQRWLARRVPGGWRIAGDPAVAARARHRLYRNRGNGTFEDVTGGLRHRARDYGMGACAARLRQRRSRRSLRDQRRTQPAVPQRRQRHVHRCHASPASGRNCSEPVARSPTSTRTATSICSSPTTWIRDGQQVLRRCRVRAPTAIPTSSTACRTSVPQQRQRHVHRHHDGMRGVDRTAATGSASSSATTTTTAARTCSSPTT